MNTPLIAVLPFCLRDSKEAGRLLEWIATLDTKIHDHALLLVADDAVPMEDKQRIKSLGMAAFDNVEAISVKAPAPVGTAYNVPAAVMFSRAMGHIDACYKWNWFWMEPDCVPLRSLWLDMLAEAYAQSPKRFLGPIITTDQPDVPKIHMAATAVYPNCANSELKKFCNGKQHFDMAFADHVVPRAQNTPLIWHRWGTPTEVPTFKETKLDSDGPNVGELSVIPKEACLFHRNKDGTLIELLRKRRETSTQRQKAKV